MIQECRGGILADEMGMGKTIEMLSLLASDKESAPASGTDEPGEDSSATLVVVPMSVLAQWASESEPHQGCLCTLTTVRRKRNCRFTLKSSDVVLTTWHVVGRGAARRGVARRQGRASCGGVGGAVLDEAHT